MVKQTENALSVSAYRIFHTANDLEGTHKHTRTGEDDVLVCSFQMGRTYMDLEEVVVVTGGVSKIINTTKCDVYCSGLKKCRCPNCLIHNTVTPCPSSCVPVPRVTQCM